MKKILSLLFLFSVLFLVNPSLFSKSDTDITLPIIKSESRGIFEQIFSKSPVAKFKNFAQLYPEDVKGIQEIEFSSRPTDSVLAGTYKETNMTIGLYRLETKKIWINNYIGDVAAIAHEIGHHVWYTKLSAEARTQWSEWFKDEKPRFSITAAKSPSDLFAEHYQLFRLHRKEYQKQFPVQFAFFTDLLEK